MIFEGYKNIFAHISGHMENQTKFYFVTKKNIRKVKLLSFTIWRSGVINCNVRPINNPSNPDLIITASINDLYDDAHEALAAYNAHLDSLKIPEGGSHE